VNERRSDRERTRVVLTWNFALNDLSVDSNQCWNLKGVKWLLFIHRDRTDLFSQDRYGYHHHVVFMIYQYSSCYDYPAQLIPPKNYRCLCLLTTAPKTCNPTHDSATSSAASVPGNSPLVDTGKVLHGNNVMNLCFLKHRCWWCPNFFELFAHLVREYACTQEKELSASSYHQHGLSRANMEILCFIFYARTHAWAQWPPKTQAAVVGLHASTCSLRGQVSAVLFLQEKKGERSSMTWSYNLIYGNTNSHWHWTFTCNPQSILHDKAWKTRDC
jgi:hypothetical protein